MPTPRCWFSFTYILFSWVLHRDDIVVRLLEQLDDLHFDFLHFTLTCDTTTLLERIAIDSDRTTDPDLALKRLEQSHVVKSIHVDTNIKKAALVAAELKARIIS